MLRFSVKVLRDYSVHEVVIALHPCLRDRIPCGSVTLNRITPHLRPRDSSLINVYHKIGFKQLMKLSAVNSLMQLDAQNYYTKTQTYFTTHPHNLHIARKISLKAGHGSRLILHSLHRVPKDIHFTPSYSMFPSLPVALELAHLNHREPIQALDGSYTMSKPIFKSFP